MRGYFSYIIVLAVITTLQSVKAVTFNAQNMRLEQSPPGPTLVMEEPKTKMTFRVSSNESQFKVLRLAVSLGSSQIQSNVIYPELTVIYNSCTDSNDPQWSCKEVQITLTKEEEEFEFQPMSFDLYHEIKLLHHLTTIQQSLPSLIITTPMATANETTSNNTTITSEKPGSNTELLSMSASATWWVIAALSLVIAVLIVALVLVLLCVCCRTTKKPQNPA